PPKSVTEREIKYNQMKGAPGSSESGRNPCSNRVARRDSGTPQKGEATSITKEEHSEMRNNATRGFP
ncbi:hypothetical protein, partial [Escherichia coli]|uniref:hypothetical protein n=1 Tax=Escherichia coli TaxID=562 RepID=UPI001AEBF40D